MMAKNKFYILGLILFFCLLLLFRTNNPGSIEVNCSDIQELKLEGRISGKSNSQHRNQIRLTVRHKLIIINGTNKTGITKLYHDLNRCSDKIEINYSKYYYGLTLKKIYIL